MLPTNASDFGENIGLFLPPNTTSLLQPMDCGVTEKSEEN
jgi:hypothetical protein